MGSNTKAHHNSTQKPWFIYTLLKYFKTYLFWKFYRHNFNNFSNLIIYYILKKKTKKQKQKTKNKTKQNKSMPHRWDQKHKLHVRN